MEPFFHSIMKKRMEAGHLCQQPFIKNPLTRKVLIEYHNNYFRFAPFSTSTPRSGWRMKRLVPLILFAALFISINAYAGHPPADPFPTYPCIQSNVNFWLKIYTRYDVTDGVLHDNTDLSIIYGIIPLENPKEPGASKINEQRINRVKEKYRNILVRLAKSPVPVLPEDERIIALIGKDAPPARYLRASEQLRCQSGQKSRFLSGLIRSGEYIDEFRQIFVSQGLPGDLIYLAHVESSYDLHATSKCGASGIWQFMAATAKRYMKVNDVLDERRDPVVSTRAAAAYLKENHELLDSWPLALTAYNHGTGSMLKARRKCGTYDRVYEEYNGPSFGFASRNFYPCFLAAREAARNHEKYFGTVELARPARTSTVIMPGYAYLHNVIRNLGVDENTIRELNPALKPSVYSGKKYIPSGYALRIPASVSASSVEMLAQAPTGTVQKTQKQSRVHVVKKGDTAFRIAQIHHVDLSDLMAANKLSNRAVLKPGQSLKIPNAEVYAD
jgi:membrane-bound lytic murein transglycosylase D